MERDFLSPACIFRSAGDPSWRPFLEAAARFEAFLDGGPTKTPENKATAETHRVALIDAARRLRRNQPHLEITRLHERWFTEAVLVWLAYRDTASAPLIDTVGSEAAYAFALDLADAEDVGDTLLQSVRGQRWAIVTLTLTLTLTLTATARCVYLRYR